MRRERCLTSSPCAGSTRHDQAAAHHPNGRGRPCCRASNVVILLAWFVWSIFMCPKELFALIGFLAMVGLMHAQPLAFLAVLGLMSVVAILNRRQ